MIATGQNVLESLLLISKINYSTNQACGYCVEAKNHSSGDGDSGSSPSNDHSKYQTLVFYFQLD